MSGPAHKQVTYIAHPYRPGDEAQEKFPPDPNELVSCLCGQLLIANDFEDRPVELELLPGLPEFGGCRTLALSACLFTNTTCRRRKKGKKKADTPHIIEPWGTGRMRGHLSSLAA